MSLRARVVALVGLVLVAGVLLGSALAGYEARRALQAELQAGMTGGVQTVLSAFEDLPRSDHAERDLHQLVATFDGNRHVRAELLAANGDVVLTSIREGGMRPSPSWFARLFGPPPSSKRIAAPVPGGRQILLSPISDIDIGALWGELCSIVIAFGLTVLGGLVLIYLAIGAALRPLRALSDGFVSIGAGDYDIRLKRRGPSELLDLQRGFNEMSARLAAMSARNRALEKQIITLQDEERADLARDLHDEIGPHLFSVNVDATMVGRLAEDGQNEAIGERVRSIQHSISYVQRLVREMLGRLRPSRATELGLNAAIADLVTFWESRTENILIDYDLLQDETALDEPLKDTIYRVVQEALSNAVRHASASRILIRVAPSGLEAIDVAVDDDGAPTGPQADGGFGIVGMRERVKASGGTLAIEIPGEWGGWSVRARLPMSAMDDVREDHI